MQAYRRVIAKLPEPVLVRLRKLRDRLWDPVVVQEFALQFRRRRLWSNVYWLGRPVLKIPLDLWIYQEILTEVRPDLIVEAGTYKGGSASFLATVCDAVGTGRVLTIDVDEAPDRPAHERIEYLAGSSVSNDTIDTVRGAVENSDRVLVILDSDHRWRHVLDELHAYADFVSIGSYLIVEDTDFPYGADPGPREAVERFLAADKRYVPDQSREKFLLTNNPGGYLKRVG